MKLVSLVFSVLILGLRLHAADLSASGIYRATSEACQQVKPADLKSTQRDKLNAGYFPSAEFTQLMTLIRSSSFKKTAFEFNPAKNDYADYILKHPEFIKALNECYPTQPKMIQFFKDSVTKSDRAGKTVGVVAIIAIFRGQGLALKAIQSWSASVHYALMAGQKLLISSYLVSLLKYDSEQPKKEKTFNDVMNSMEKAIESKQVEIEKTKQIKSLQAQISAEELKIEKCGQCKDAEMLKRQLNALRTITSVLKDN